MYKFELNADLNEVWLRLAGNFKADVADHSARFVHENTRANTSPSAPDLGMDDRESE